MVIVFYSSTIQFDGILLQRYRKFKLATFSYFTFHPNSSVMFFDKFFAKYSTGMFILMYF